MTIPKLLFFAVLYLGLLVGCNQQYINGSGNRQTESRPVADFHHVNLGWAGEMVLRQGEQESLTISGDDNILPLLTSEVRRGQLTITIASPYHNDSIRPSQPVQYELTVRDLTAVTVSGAATLRADPLVVDSLTVTGSGAAIIHLAHLEANALILQLTGSSRATAAGQVESQQATLSGSAIYNAPSLQSRQAALTVAGSGQAIVAAGDTLTVNISGSGQVIYHGRPQITQTLSGAGALTAADEAE